MRRLAAWSLWWLPGGLHRLVCPSCRRWPRVRDFRDPRGREVG
jgi:hypothetical protein